MEWREQSAVSCDDAYTEAQRWIEAVTKKKFVSSDFRSELENGVLFCDLINRIKPGIIRRVNRLPTPIAGLDNLNVFLKACGKLGLKEAQLFHPGDLQDLSTRVTVKHQETHRRLKNVLITIYWLGRRAQCDPLYNGPYLNFKAFEGLLGTALYKALQESASHKGSSVRDSGFGESWYSEREELYQLRGGGGAGHRRDDSLDSLDSLGSRPHSVSSDTTLKGSSEGCCSDTETDSVFGMAENKDQISYRRSVVITPKTTTPFNQFLPSKDKASGYVPAPLRKKRAERNEDSRRSWASSAYSEDESPLTSETGPSPERCAAGRASQTAVPAAPLQWEYGSGSDSDLDRPDPDVVLDDLASRRFHSPSPAPPANFAVPISPLAGGRTAGGGSGSWSKVTMTPSVVAQQNATCCSGGSVRVNHHSLFREDVDSEDEDDEVGYADPIQDDLYARKMGVKPQPAGNASYDKFLPKFWTPEEDVHLQKIKLGSQRRPWYKKMQGFSYKKSGSSSDDSDCDIGPWLSSAPSPSGPSHSHAREASAHSALVVGKSSHIPPHTLPQLPKIQPPLLETPPLLFAPVDPSSGPKLVKCEKWPLLGRHDPRKPPDPLDYDSMIPDLENDDMFARRTLAFQSNVYLAMAKTPLPSPRRYTSEPQLNIVTQRRHRGSTEENDFPDIEQDDVVYRKEKTQQAQQQRPLSGAPDNYAAMPIPEPWCLPPDLKSRLLCAPCPLAKEPAAKEPHQVEGNRRKADDMLIRKLGAPCDQSQSLWAGHVAPTAPPTCSDGDLQRWQAIREASQLRYKKRLMVERLAALKLQQQEQESPDGSKSTSDILAEEPAVVRQVRYEELQKFREHVKQSEDKWQDDLSKWKNRRRSVNSDIVKKKEERETIEQITYGNRRRSKTFKEMQEERENKGRLGSLSYLDDENVFAEPVVSPRARTLPTRSHTIDTPYFSPDTSEASSRQVEARAASPAAGRASSREAHVVDSPAGGDATLGIAPGSRTALRGSPSPAAPAPQPAPGADRTEEAATTVSSSRSVRQVPEPKRPPAGAQSEVAAPSSSSLYRQHPQLNSAAAPLQKYPVSVPSGTAKKEDTTTPASSSSSPQRVLAPRRPLSATQPEAEAPSSGPLYKQQPQLSSMEPKPPGVSRVSASLPRSYQRSDSARLPSFVAPRPFGSQSSRITSLPRASTMDDSSKRVNGDVGLSKKSTVPSRYHQFMTSEDEAQSSSAQSSEEEEEKATAPKSITPAQSIPPAPAPVKSEAAVSPSAAKEPAKEDFCDMRISLNQKPNSSRDFGFQANWDSTGARVTSVQPGSPAEMCQLQAGDEVLTVNGHQVAGMSYTDWKSHLGEALQEGSLVMDIRRHGKNSPDRNVANKSSLDFTSRIPTEAAPPKKAPAEPVADDASSRVNGGFGAGPVTMRNKESEPISLKNLKRRSEFFEQGGSETPLPDIPVPSITPSSSRWSWDPEEERRRQEKWQKEQERLLQEKYKRDQEKLQEEWLKAQQEVAKSHQEPGSLDVNSHGIGPHAPLSSISEPTPGPWEEEERKRKEELERQRQAEERRKREEEERQLQLLREERRRKEKQEEEERRRREEEELRWQKKKKEEEREEERRRQKALEQQWAPGSSGFDSVQPPLSATDRAKSKSSPQLDEEDKPQRKGAHVPPRGMAQWLLEEQLRDGRDKQARSQRATSELERERRNILNAMRYREPERVTGQQPVSQVELERQQILNEMKKKTSLLTDGSWIRQRSTDAAGGTRESDVLPMRRGESLDNLDTSYNSWRSSWTPRSNAPVQNYGRPQSALSGSSSFYGGASGAQRPGSSTLPSSYSAGSLRGGAGSPSAPWSRQTPSPSLSSPSPITSPEPEAGVSQQRSRSVSGKKICTFCDAPLGKGAAMIIESLGLCYHLSCFKCIDCKSDLGGSEAGAEVRIRNKQLYCNTCYVRFKSAQPTVM